MSHVLDCSVTLSWFLEDERTKFTDQILNDFGIPRETLSYIDYPSDYDSRDSQAALEGSGIATNDHGDARVR